MAEITVKEANPSDAQKILDYMKIIGGETDNLTYGAEGRNISVEKEASILKTMHDDNKSVFYCAWDGSELVGTANLSGMPRRMAHRAEIGISVLKAYWNRGIGTKLLRHLIDYSKEHEIEIINLEVRSDNAAAIHLYKKYGFDKTGTIPAFFKIGNEYIDFDLMSLDMRK
ncbi:GNAT family N-acetyltransferase [Butyrivibrio sp. CB08]|uniref:GNAT family N-acetyltransferase n=1 Tax=Butyrivibrio sp. CB08 TaxID=2364879 RepID=UPI000EA934E4|nr:GNAT family N-acetyltransferase [Butyrivibrio sp. CB08]RKM60580.1 GNAT family N-acetyltransferase [Butyrivibrio sp. CB08]